MAPNVSSTGVLYEADEDPAGAASGNWQDSAHLPRAFESNHKLQIVWRSVIFIGFISLYGLCGLYLALTSAKLVTTAFAVFLSAAAFLGTTAGAHRLWSHKAYKATAPLRVLLMLLQTLSLSYSVIGWARTHRTHHKYADTDADPHNSSRGFFFSHIGWLLRRKHPAAVAKAKEIVIADLESDPVLAFQKRYYSILGIICGFVLPLLIPMYLWDETFLNAWSVAIALRCTCVWNLQSMINSVAHLWGSRPYDRTLTARDGLTPSIFTLGEGWHNYHHTFPWDYKAAELGHYRANLTTAFIDLMARIGWAYDLKTVPAAMVQARVERTGDGSHEVWGWGDRDMADEDYRMARIENKRG